MSNTLSYFRSRRRCPEASEPHRFDVQRQQVVSRNAQRKPSGRIFGPSADRLHCGLNAETRRYLSAALPVSVTSRETQPAAGSHQQQRTLLGCFSRRTLDTGHQNRTLDTRHRIRSTLSVVCASEHKVSLPPRLTSRKCAHS
jgi:hypothetical protein